MSDPGTVSGTNSNVWKTCQRNSFMGSWIRFGVLDAKSTRPTVDRASLTRNAQSATRAVITLPREFRTAARAFFQLRMRLTLAVAGHTRTRSEKESPHWNNHQREKYQGRQHDDHFDRPNSHGWLSILTNFANRFRYQRLEQTPGYSVRSSSPSTSRFNFASNSNNPESNPRGSAENVTREQIQSGITKNSVSKNTATRANTFRHQIVLSNTEVNTRLHFFQDERRTIPERKSVFKKGGRRSCGA